MGVGPIKSPVDMLVSVKGSRPYLYADNAGKEPVQWEFDLHVVAYRDNEDVEYRYRKRSWPSGHWCEFATREGDVSLPVRPGSYLVIQSRCVREYEFSDWCEPYYLRVFDGGDSNITRGKPPDWDS